MFNEQADVQFDAALAQTGKAGHEERSSSTCATIRVVCYRSRRTLPRASSPSGPIVWVKEKNGQMSSLNVEDRQAPQSALQRHLSSHRSGQRRFGIGG